MKHQVVNKQKNSKMCFLCGLKNPFGLQGHFYELDNNELVCVFTPRNEHQSYPGRLHGGIVSAVLDETIGRAILIGSKEEVWGVTIEFKVEFRKQVPLNQELRVVGRITKKEGRIFEGTGELKLLNGEIAATAYGKYLRMPLSKISEFDPIEQEWQVVRSEKDPQVIDV